MSKDLFFESRQDELAALVDKAEQGEVSALAIYADIKRMKGMYSDAEKQIEPIAMFESEAWSEKTFEHKGFIFEKRSGSVRYSYKEIPEWQTYSKALKNCEARLKQAFLSRQKGLLVANEDGEEMILPKVSYTKDCLIVKK